MEANVKKLKDGDWTILIQRLKQKTCTPFLGPGVCRHGFEQLQAISRQFAESSGYPMKDTEDLARVGRFLSVEYDADYARNMLFEAYRKLPPLDLTDETDPHVVLASLPIPVYLTTNHNDFMMQALRAQDKDPNAELCKWNSSVVTNSSLLPEGEELPNPTAAQPLVFHMYGYPQLIDANTVLDSLVFTEDDYYEFLINVSSEDNKAIPLRVLRAMAGTSLLLLGYRMEERDFRVLFHYLLAKPLKVSKNRVHVAVQVPVDEAEPEEQRKKVQEFLDRYIEYKQLDIRVYWGSTHEFTTELKARWEAAK